MIKTTRRAFLGGAAALTGASLVGYSGVSTAIARPPRAQEKEGKAGPLEAPPFDLGLASYTFREYGLDDLVTMTKRVGLRRVCLKDVHLPLDSPPGTIREVTGRLREAGLVPYGCGVVYMKNEAEVRRAFAYARDAGMELIVGVPDPGMLDLVEGLIGRTGLALAIHNHGPGDLLYPTPRSILDRVEGRDRRLGMCLDVGHCQRAGIDPSEAAVTCGPRLLDVHLKDVTASGPEGGPVEAGRGVIDLPRFLRTLLLVKYGGTAAFEYEKDGHDPLPGLAESVGYVRGLMAGGHGPC